MRTPKDSSIVLASISPRRLQKWTPFANVWASAKSSISRLLTQMEWTDACQRYSLVGAVYEEKSAWGDILLCRCSLISIHYVDRWGEVLTGCKSHSKSSSFQKAKHSFCRNDLTTKTRFKPGWMNLHPRFSRIDQRHCFIANARIEKYYPRIHNLYLSSYKQHIIINQSHQ